MRAIERRLHKLEEIRDRDDVGSEVDIELERMGASRGALLADFGSLIAFRDWLVAREIAATGHQAGVPVVRPYRQQQLVVRFNNRYKHSAIMA